MKKFIFLLLLCACSTEVFAAEPSTNVVQGNRFLFVVENSSAMSRSAKAAQQIVRELIESGVQGEMRTGDTYGIWTYDEQLNMTFPVQQWSSAGSQLLALSAEDFLRKHLYQNNGDLKIVLPKIYSLIKNSKSITVILISTGSEPIHGTPFDKEMNLIYPQYSRELHDAKIPFVTILIGFNGRPVAYSVNSSLEIHIPQPPIKPKPLATTITTNSVTSTSIKIPEAPAENVLAKIAPKSEPKKMEVDTPVISTNISAPIVAPKLTFTTPTETEPIKLARENPPTTAVEKSGATKKAETQPVITYAVSEEKAKPPVVQKTVEPPSPIQSSPVEAVATHQPRTKAPEVAATPVVATQPLLSPKKLLLAGAVLLLAAVVLVFLLFRNTGKSGPSLISHSLTEKNK